MTYGTSSTFGAKPLERRGGMKIKRGANAPLKHPVLS
jgi:hypothetical protein